MHDKRASKEFIIVKTVYTYDAAGRLESVSDSSGVLATYTYDAQNLRTKKVVTGGATTHYVYGAGGLLSGEYDNMGGLIREYVYHYGEPVAQIDSGMSETLIYLHTDHLGTPRKGSNASGSNVWSWDSDAFGVGAPTGSAEVNLRFAGQYFDAESGLHYNWNRYYDPATGRYVSSDPIGLGGGINTFGYSLANPVMFVDPEGLTAVAGTPQISTGSWPSSTDITGPIAAVGSRVPAVGIAVGILEGVVRPCAEAVGVAIGKGILAANQEGEEGESPEVDPKDIEGKTPEEIEEAAEAAGLIPKGPDPKSGRGSWDDPETGEQRVLCHPNCKSGNPNAHVNNPQGERLDVDGNVVDEATPEAHLPIDY